MKRITKQSEFASALGELPINNCDGQSLGCYVQILQRLSQQLQAMLERYARVYVVRIDCHCLSYIADNQLISSLMKKLTRKLKAKYPRIGDIAYVWARETGVRAGKTHYHLALLLNGHAINSPKAVTALVKLVWCDELGQGQVQTTWGDAKMLARGDSSGLKQVFYWLSYLAKVYTKGQRKPTANDYSASQLKVRSVSDSLSYVA